MNLPFILLLFLLPVNGEAPRHQDVDHIEDIEVEQTQVIITTTKEGPVEHLKIHIELVDIEANKKVNPVDLSGLWLTITRGRYTIPFLRPDTWYGVRFRSENLINGLKVVHEDERLVKTKPREENLASLLLGPPHGLGPTQTPQVPFLPPKIGVQQENVGVQYPIGPNGPNHPTTLETHENQKSHQKEKPEKLDAIDVKMHRSLDGVENFESLYVTVEWKDQQHQRSNLTSGVVKLRVICDSSETKEVIKLKGDEDSVTIEITMDQKYDIEEMDALKHQIKAHITPLKCHNLPIPVQPFFRICWTSDLVLSSGFGDFTKHLGEECKEISGTTSTTFLRNVKKVSVIENSLSVNELVVETEVAESEYGLVNLVLKRLGGNDTEDPINYEYIKTKPFHYTSNTHFLAESPAPNSTKATFPLVDLSVVPSSFDYKHDKPDTVLKPEPPFLLLSRSPHFSENDILVKVEPFCNETGLKFRLTDHYPLHHLDSIPFLCGLEPKMYFCDKNVTYHKCDSTFCFSTAVLIGLDSYGSETRCLNLTHHFPPLKSASSSPHRRRPFGSLLCLCVSLLVTLFRRQAL